MPADSIPLTKLQAAGGNGSLNELAPSGVGLLHLFAALGHEWGLTALLLAGAAVDLRDAQGRSPLHWAAARGHEVHRRLCVPCMLDGHGTHWCGITVCTTPEDICVA
jgi:ankyrin repeat protein